MNILFMGTPEFAVPSIEALKKSGYNVIGVVTQPDKPKGRGYKMSAHTIKEYAIENDISVYKPKSMGNNCFINTLEELNPDIIVVVAYGKVLPKYILDYPKYGCINVHASLLPKYRGAAPIHRSIINGEKKTGITIMYMNEGLDTGDIIVQKEIPIEYNDTAGHLHDKMSVLGGQVLLSAIELIKDNKAPRYPQDDKEATYAPMLNKDESEIEWSASADKIRNFIRGLNPWPVAYTYYNGKKLKLWSAEIYNSDAKSNPGTILEHLANRGLVIAAGEGTTIIINNIQFEGGKRMTVDEYMRGHSITMGKILGRL